MRLGVRRVQLNWVTSHLTLVILRKFGKININTDIFIYQIFMAKYGDVSMSSFIFIRILSQVLV